MKILSRRLIDMGNKAVVYFDGGTKYNLICVVRGDIRVVKKMKKKMTNNELEWMALLLAIQFMGSRVEGKDITVYGDSKLIINQMNGKNKINKEVFAAIKDQCVAEADYSFDKYNNVFRYVWVNRDENKAGIRLDKIVRKINMRGGIWYD